MPAACSAFTISLNSVTCWPRSPDELYGRIGSEVADRVVTPVVRQALVEQVLRGEEVMHGHQFDGRDAHQLEVLDRRGVGEPRVGAPDLLRDAGMSLRETP